ncbi:hypothetical protein GGQ91_000886 [Methylobacterium fujisawaense]|uniref:Uncharacterized protein n=1 Tax=Methylobacterium fujisawaense TaxID=107400 RepID=A0ABR6D6V8_9HYPH|nr:hypothetical protein [Methylobacterium fujisawaense]MBA9061525.1 hypothetical protein [Methylobacterium fujisawaense]
MRLNLAGNAFLQRVKGLSGLDGPEAQEFAEAACLRAFGRVPCNIQSMTDEEIRALIPIVRAAHAALELVTFLLEQRGL